MRESNVESFDSKLPFKFCGPQASQKVSEGAEFYAGAVLTYCLPTLTYCVVTRQVLPLLLMAINHALGILIGVLLYEKQNDSLLSCVPKHRIPSTQIKDARRETKRVA
jgi:hypothetical protein